jgi:hypothetical protein
VSFKFRFIGISNSHPKSSGIKMVDTWMLVSLVQPLVDVLLQTYLDDLHHGTLSSDQEAKLKMERVLKRKDQRIHTRAGLWTNTRKNLMKNR